MKRMVRTLADVVRGTRTKYLVLTLIVGVVIIIGTVISPFFLTLGNFQNVLVVASIMGVAAVGQTFALLIRELDLSVGSVMSLVVVVLVAIQGSSVLDLTVAVLACLVLGAAIGALNGLFVAWARASSLIVTLATMVLAQGIALQLRKSPGGTLPSGFSAPLRGYVYGVPVALLIFLGILLVAWFFLGRTRLGSHIYATGMDDQSARLAGVGVSKMKVLCFMLAGLLAAVSGILMAGRLSSADPRVGEPFAFESITAVVLGGTTFVGGQGGVIGTAYGALLIALVRNILNLADVSPFYQYVARGLILFIIVAAYSSSHLLRRRT